MQKVVILQGLPASGKSTWAKNHVLSNPGWKRINRDELRRMVDAGKYSKENEKLIRKYRQILLSMALDYGHSVIIDDTNFEETQINSIKYTCNDYGIEPEIKIFNVDPKECITRNALRPETERVPEAVIWDMYHKYVEPNEYKTGEQLVQDPTLPYAIICDLDGTLAIHNGRSPYDGKSCSSDLVNRSVKKVLDFFQDNGYEIIFVSGRNDGTANETVKWLKEVANITSFHLYMREEGDHRKDNIIKKEIFDKYIRDNYYIEFVLDDRDQVVELWRSLGLTCFQVNYGNF